MKKFIFICLALVFVAGFAIINLNAEEITFDKAKAYIGKEMTVCGKIIDAMPLQGMGITLLGMGKSSQVAGAVGIEISDKIKKDLPEDLFKGKDVCVTGKIHMNPVGGASMAVTDPKQIVAK